MIDAHQDVAGLVARLRANPHGSLHINTRAGINEPTSMIKEAADRLESLSQALREVEDDVLRLHSEKMDSLERALAAEFRLAEAMRLLDDISSFSVSEALDQSGKFADVCKAWIERKKPARAFIAGNGGKDGE